ncbi:MAG: S41 family peptidase [bacterium]|nr:S41 family peptidase [bacterium]
MINQKSLLFTLILVFLTHSLYSQQHKSVSDKKYKKEVIQTIGKLIQTKYVIPEAAEKYAAELKKKHAAGCYDSCTDSKEFAKTVTADLISITHDKHFNFRVNESSEVGEKAESALHHPVRYHLLRAKENTGFFKMEWIENSIGYVDIRRCYSFDLAKDLIIAAMKFLANSNAIIIDVRENGGGSGDYLSSYFLPYPTQLTGWYSRETDWLTEFWTIKDIGAEPLLDTPVFILTSNRTFSASEAFAYDMKVRKRATIIGDSTRGGAHSVDLYKIDDQFEIYISTERAVNPITGENWEGVGVIPDILVPSEVALDTAIALARKAGKEYARAKEAKLKQAVAEMQIHLHNAETFYRSNKENDADAALDSVFQIGVTVGLINEFFIDVLAYNYQSDKDEPILYAILKKKIAVFPRSVSAYERLASVYYSKGKKALARQYFQKVLELDPDNRNAAKMIKRIRDAK